MMKQKLFKTVLMCMKRQEQQTASKHTEGTASKISQDARE